MKSKKIREKGKIKFSRYFQEFKEGDKVAVIEDTSVKSSFPKRIQGRTGTIEKKKGRSYYVNISESKKGKKFLIEPIHLKKINQINK